MRTVLRPEASGISSWFSSSSIRGRVSARAATMRAPALSSAWRVSAVRVLACSVETALPPSRRV